MPPTKQHLSVLVLTVAVTVVAWFQAVPEAAADDGLLKGNIRQDGFLRPTKADPADVRDRGDPFGADGQDQFASDDFDSQPARSEKPFDLNVKQHNAPRAPVATQSLPSKPRLPAQAQQARTIPNDPDSSQELMLAWDDWHKRVAEAVFIKVQTLAGTALMRSPPLMAQVGYTVSKDGRIGNVQMLQPSQNSFYDEIIMTAVRSMETSPLLQFPPGSKRMTVQKFSTFQHNWGGPSGYRYLMNDQETVQGGKH